MNRRPHIAIVYLDHLPESFGEETYRKFEYEGLKVTVHRKEAQLFASAEWMVPSLITAYVLKSYFDGFLKEAGKDHFQQLKASIGNLLSFAKENAGSVKILTSSGEKKSTSHQSKVLSIYIETKYGKRIKVLFDERLSLEDWKIGLSSILQQMNDSYEHDTKSGLSDLIESYTNHPKLEVYAILDRDSKTWRFLNIRGAAAQSKDN